MTEIIRSKVDLLKGMIYAKLYSNYRYIVSDISFDTYYGSFDMPKLNVSFKIGKKHFGYSVMLNIFMLEESKFETDRALVCEVHRFEVSLANLIISEINKTSEVEE